MIFKPLINSHKFVADFSSISDAVVKGNYLTPPMISKAYNMPESTGFKVTIGIISLGGGFLQSDLDRSMSDLGLESPSINFISIDSATNDFDNSVYSIENTLDIFCIASMVPDATINIYIASPDMTNNSQVVSDFNAAVQQAINDGCDLINISWGTNEVGDHGQPGGDVFDTVLANAEALGITVFVASGDFGSYNPTVDNSVNPLLGIAPVYPASSARVIAVGGTYLTLNTDGTRNTEYAAQNSGGGISRIIPVPAWQDKLPYIGAGLLSNTSTKLVKYALTNSPRVGRGVPDLAAPYYNYVFYFNNALVAANGTSASCPVILGMFARFISLNHGRRPAYGASTFMTEFYPFVKTAFFNATFDKTFTNTGVIGNSDITTANIANINAGYISTTNSWNPVTGLGAPNGRNLYRLTGVTGQTYPYNSSSRPGNGILYPRKLV